MTTDRRSGLGRLVALALVGGLAVAACGGGGHDKKASDDLQKAVDDAVNGLDTSTTAGSGEAGTPARLGELKLDLPRETTYAGATWTLNRVLYRAAGPDESGTHQPPGVEVDFSVANTDPKAQEMTIDGTMLSLLDKAGFRTAADPATASSTVAAGGKADLKVTFDVESSVTQDDVHDDTFAIGDTDSEPALIPFTGTMPAAGYPLTVKMPPAVDGMVLDTMTNGGVVGRATLHDIAATISLDHNGARAAKGTRFLMLAGKVDVHEGIHGYVNQNDLRLSVGGVVQPVVDSVLPDPSVSLPAGSTADVTWTFTIPTDGTAGSLAFGSHSPPGTKPGAFTLPHLP
jgi:hypothetical protein